MDRTLDVLNALADPTRLRIFALLGEMELSVGELAQVLGLSQPRVSRHIKILSGAGLTARRREGSWVFLKLGEGAEVTAAVQLVDTLAGDASWRAEDSARLSAVHAERARHAQNYFDQHAEQWDAIRALHIEDSQVETAIRDLLDGKSVGTLVDIGTGTGRMLELLGPDATQMLGVDRSPEMLRLARAKLKQAGLEPDLRQGDMYALPLDSGSADTVILHHLLHFTHQPDTAITEAARLVRSGGRLMVIDFASHEREELRADHAHVRLGFDDVQLDEWFGRCGLTLAPVRELHGGALTVKIWLGERPASTTKETQKEKQAA